MFNDLESKLQSLLERNITSVSELELALGGSYV